MIKRIISLLIAVSIMMSLSAGVMAAGVEWYDPENQALYTGATGEGMRFRPADKTMSKQNPPDFSWPMAIDYTNVKYHLIISDKEDMSNIVYEVKDLEMNVYNFPHTFEKKTYYWQVRWTCDEGVAEWSDVRRFTIRDDATDFVVPENLDELINKIDKNHPRTFGIDRVKETIEKRGLSSYSGFKTRAEEAVKNGVQPEPQFVSGEGDQALRSRIAPIYKIPFYCAVTYQVYGDEEVAKAGVNQLIAMCDWDAENGATSYNAQDQIDREIMYLGAISYDYLYDFIPEDAKQKIRDMIYQRMQHWSYFAFDKQGLLYSPYNSHAMNAFGFIGVTCIALFEDERFQSLLERIVRIYCNLHSQWRDDDGSDWWGTGYSQYVNYLLMEDLKGAGIIDLFQKPCWRNQENWHLYIFSQDQEGGAFGDQSNMSPSGYSQDMLAKSIIHNNSGVAQYLFNLSSYNLNTQNEDWLVTYNPDITPIAPTFKPRAKHFLGNGYVAMHSDLIDKNRVSLLFRSSQYGSDNHAHADQNSFIIKAYGKELALDSGYMDAYYTEFDRGYTRNTYSQNAITVDGGKGQPSNDITARGKITNFANGPDFDSVTGDATESYKGQLDKAVRHMIYIRPDVFICIDDLKATEGKESNFEWWLNAKYDIYAYDSKDGARIINENAALDMKVQYPTNMTMGYSDAFTGMDYSEQYTPTGNYESMPVHKRVWFQTEKTPKTKIITTMDVHRADKPADYVKKTEFEKYIELRFQDGSIAYIPTTDETHITAGKYEFDAAALVVKGDGFILVDGTSLKENGKDIVKAEKPLTVTYSDNELNFTYIDDNNMEVTLPGINTIKDKNNVEVILGEPREEMTVTKDGDTLKFSGFANEYNYYFNNKILAGQPISDKIINVYLNGTPYKATMSGYLDHDGVARYNGILPSEIPGGFYTVTALDKGINLDDKEAGQMVYLAKGQNFLASGDASNIYLSSLESAAVEVTDKVYSKDNVSAFLEAEEYETLGSGQIYRTRAFMSGAAGVTSFNTPKTKSTWKLTVKEAGNYDVVFKYVAFDNDKVLTDAERIITLNGKTVSAKLPITAGYGSVESEWREAKVGTGVWLEPGEYELEIIASYGSWNMDWIGLSKK